MSDLEPCPECGGEIAIYPSYGGRGTGELTFYRAECKGCDFKADHLGSADGRMRSARSEWTRYARQRRKP